jgi:membrane protease subunit HflC
MSKQTVLLFGIAVPVVAIGLILLATSIYTVNEGEYVLIMSFGEPVGDPIKNPGLKFKIPIVQRVIRLPAHRVEWTSSRLHCVTGDNYAIEVEAYAKWQISDPWVFFRRVRDEFRARSRVDDILSGETCRHLRELDFLDLVASNERRTDKWLSTLTAGTVLEPSDQITSHLEAAIMTKGQARVIDLGFDIIEFRLSTFVYNQGHSSEDGSGGG